MFRAESVLSCIAAVVFLFVSLGLAGCRTPKEPASPAFIVRPPGGQTNVVIAPVSLAVGRVVSVVQSAKFAVVTFPIGQVPANGARFAVFHAGAKVGELHITGPAAETLTVGDLTVGSAQEGDEVRGE